MFGIWVIAIGLAMLILGIWSWRGRTWRSRWWTRGHNGDGFLCFGPTVSLLTLGFGIAFLAESLHFDALYAAGAVVVLGGFLVFLYSGLVMLISPIWWPAQKRGDHDGIHVRPRIRSMAPILRHGVMGIGSRDKASLRTVWISGIECSWLGYSARGQSRIKPVQSCLRRIARRSVRGQQVRRR